MANILKINELHQLIITSLQNCGCDILYIKKINTHPLEIGIKYNNNEIHLRIFIWNISHGGKNRAGDEYRIQIKIPKNCIILEDDIILGYYEQGVFVGYDTSKHLNPTWSSSMQIKEHILNQAHTNGFCEHTNRYGETIIAFNPTYFAVYLENQKGFHVIVDKTNDNKTIIDNILEDSDIVIENKPRQEIYQTIKKKVRNADFRKRVLGTYNNRCAFCGLQLNIVEAAHILPVSIPLSTDNTTNGLCLCPNHHKTYDNGLLFIDDNYKIIQNKKHITKLIDLKLTDKLDDFLNNTRQIIILPNDKRDYPNIEFIKEANKLRIDYES